MSVTTMPVGVFRLMQERGLMPEPAEAADFGSMEFDSREPRTNPPFEAMFRAAGVEMPPSFYADDGRLYGTAGDFWRALGWGYRSYDIDGRFGSTVTDLNVDAIPEADRATSSLTMNGGTSEHVFNQYNFFRQFHDVTKVGGLMFHVVPFHLLNNHGLYSYGPGFFHSLATYNDYEILGLWQCGKPHFNAYRPGDAKPEGRRVVLMALMRRRGDGEFAFPLQVNEPMVISRAAEERYGAFTTRGLEEFSTSGVLPEEFYLELETGNVLDGPLPAGDVAPVKAKKVKEKSPEKEQKKAAPKPSPPFLRRLVGTVRRRLRGLGARA